MTQTWTVSYKELKAIRTTVAGKLPWPGNHSLTFPREAIIELAKTNARTKILKCIHAQPIVQKETLESNEIRVVSSFLSSIVAPNWIIALGRPS
jgi:hypothetical protein